MAENYNGMAVGIFELDSFAACFVALDAASKAANIRIRILSVTVSVQVHVLRCVVPFPI